MCFHRCSRTTGNLRSASSYLPPVSLHGFCLPHTLETDHFSRSLGFWLTGCDSLITVPMKRHCSVCWVTHGFKLQDTAKLSTPFRGVARRRSEAPTRHKISTRCIQKTAIGRDNKGTSTLNPAIDHPHSIPGDCIIEAHHSPATGRMAFGTQAILRSCHFQAKNPWGLICYADHDRDQDPAGHVPAVFVLPTGSRTASFSLHFQTPWYQQQRKDVTYDGMELRCATP